MGASKPMSKLQLVKNKRKKKRGRVCTIDHRVYVIRRTFDPKAGLEPGGRKPNYLLCLLILLRISELKRKYNEAGLIFGHNTGDLVPSGNTSSIAPPTHCPFTQARGFLPPGETLKTAILLKGKEKE